MDDDPVLRALGAALEREDPQLAALLRAGPSPATPPVLSATGAEPAEPVAPPNPAGAAQPGGTGHPDASAAQGASVRRASRNHRRLVRCLFLVTMLVLGATARLGLAAFGVLGIVLLVASPIIACWWGAAAVDELRPPEQG